jgi:integrase
MASIERYQAAKGPRWKVQYRGPDGKTTSRRFGSAREAKAFAEDTEHDKRVGAFVAYRNNRVTFAEMAERWSSVANHAPQTAISVESDLRLHILPTLGRYPMGNVSALELQALQRALEAKLAPATTARVWARVSAVFTAARTAGVLRGPNPCDGLSLSRSSESRLLVPLEPEAAEAIVEAMPARFRIVGILAANAGLRISEALGLTVERVSFLGRNPQLLVERQLLPPMAGVGYRLTLPKDAKVRAVPVGPSVLEALAEHLATFPRGLEVADAVDGSVSSSLVVSSDGRPAHRTIVEKWFKRAALSVGVDGVTPHSLRHFFAAVLIDAGLSEREVGIRLGHSSAQVTRRYGHLFGAADDRSRDAVEANVTARRAALTANAVKMQSERLPGPFAQR